MLSARCNDVRKCFRNFEDMLRKLPFCFSNPEKSGRLTSGIRLAVSTIVCFHASGMFTDDVIEPKLMKTLRERKERMEEKRWNRYIDLSEVLDNKCRVSAVLMRRIIYSYPWYSCSHSSLQMRSPKQFPGEHWSLKGGQRWTLSN